MNIGHKIIHISRQIDRIIGKRVAQYGVTNIQAKIIGFLYCESSKRNIFQKDIEERFDIRRSSVTSVLNLMESNGIIQRVSVEEDGRLKKIMLLEKGREIQSAVYQQIVKVEDYMTEALTPGERELLFELLDKISEKISEED